MSALDPGAVQRQAADGRASVWVAASAGTGKTKVLTDRVLALMLAGSEPSRILCLTFTKAAAAEMANRINERLSRWATVGKGRLAQELQALTGELPGDATLDHARRLFARVLRETVRSQDVVARQGGEEFVVVFPSCGVEAATPILARVREALRDALATGGVPAFTASFGLADTTDQAGFEAALRAADAALMRAKNEGRDRLVVADGPVAPELAL